MFYVLCSMRRPKVTVGAIIEKESKILLVKRNSKPFRNYWTFSGGHIEWGETALEAIRREVKEETGLDLIRPKFFIYDNEFFPKLNWHAIALIFYGKAKGKIKLQEKEVKEIRWFSKKDLSKIKLAFHHSQILKRYFPLFRSAFFKK